MRFTCLTISFAPGGHLPGPVWYEGVNELSCLAAHHARGQGRSSTCVTRLPYVDESRHHVGRCPTCAVVLLPLFFRLRRADVEGDETAGVDEPAFTGAGDA